VHCDAEPVPVGVCRRRREESFVPVTNRLVQVVDRNILVNDLDVPVVNLNEQVVNWSVRLMIPAFRSTT
jgi:hypothetical protein